MLPFPPSERASVERGDPLSIYGLRVISPLDPRTANGRAYDTMSPARTRPPEPDSSQAVTTHPEILDTEANRDYGDAMLPQAVESAPTGTTAPSAGEAISGGWSEEARLAFLARAQRIDPRTAK